MNKKLLLISNSTNAGEAYLGWPREAIKNYLKTNGIKHVLFIPYAGVGLTYDDYTSKVNTVFTELGSSVYGIHNEVDPVKAVNEAEAIAVGGGNTFHLVYMLHKLKLMEAIKTKVLEGTPYMGWSAGSNVACPTLKTTNDMPIIEPESFNCTGLIPFQINPHYLDANPEGHGGETREQRIEEFMEVNQNIYVVGLREATYLLVEGNSISLHGNRPMRIFKYGKPAYEIQVGDNIEFLMK
ncbi:MAG: dipeptidase PepE [Bacteroidetes bacterium]|nr:dipeptidase PepE [Bacteroidota bacterium]